MKRTTYFLKRCWRCFHSIIIQNSGFYSVQLEKLIACLYDPGKEETTKNKYPVTSCVVVIGTTKEMNETDLARHITSNFVIQFISKETL